MHIYHMIYIMCIYMCTYICSIVMIVAILMIIIPLQHQQNSKLLFLMPFLWVIIHLFLWALDRSLLSG